MKFICRSKNKPSLRISDEWTHRSTPMRAQSTLSQVVSAEMKLYGSLIFCVCLYVSSRIKFVRSARKTWEKYLLILNQKMMKKHANINGCRIKNIWKVFKSVYSRLVPFFLFSSFLSFFLLEINLNSHFH